MSLSNADVERFFSYMKGVKSRYQNIMKNPMLSGILYMLYGLKLQVLSARRPTYNNDVAAFQLEEHVVSVQVETADVTYDSDKNDDGDLYAAANISKS